MADTHSSAQPQVCEGAAPTSCINNTDIVVLVRAQVSECMAQRCRFGELRYSIGVNGTAFVDLIQFNLGVSRFIVLVAAAVQRSANRQLARGGIKVVPGVCTAKTVFSYQTFLSIKATNHLNPVIKKENIGINSFPVKKMSPHICSITVIHRIMDKFLRQKILAVPCLQG